LESPDPRERLSVYHDMPFAIFRYDPDEELELRKRIKDLKTNLENRGKRVHLISLAECLDSAMESERPLSEWFEVERDLGLPTMVETIHSILAEYRPLVELVAERLPRDADPLRDIVFLWRTGALFPVYRTFALLEQLKGHTQVPTILFYPGLAEGPAGLRFMGVLEAEHNYRAKIF
ncbi:MAG: BREX protein BrxB domain-containing protein, partial [Thermoanaerobaculia bacterium]